MHEDLIDSAIYEYGDIIVTMTSHTNLHEYMIDPGMHQAVCVALATHFQRVLRQTVQVLVLFAHLSLALFTLRLALFFFL